MTAKIVETVGMDFAFLSGFALEASQLAAPDVGLVTCTELVGQLSRITSAVDLPVLCDIDAGFGGLNNVWRTTREVHRAGAAGLQVEDQANPKRCPVLPGRIVTSRSEGVDRVATVVDAADDEEFLVIARTDADELGLDEVVERCNLYLTAGAQVVLPIMQTFEGRARRSLAPDRQMEILAELATAIDGPLATTAPPEGYTATDMTTIGFSMVIHPTELLEASMTAIHQVAAVLATTGKASGYFESHPSVHSGARAILEYLDADAHVARETPRSDDRGASTSQ
ncbi:isocitrate lyase/PEP mutase family protein [Modestobacter excelsi]|uniref:isocitrate lyase/PEP mutase family protein n=1 Tax=Modestobacter excelsi TaxID=2213161 RepID=UPI00110CD5FD|nr:isocitrate lyase/PEP mutase family protein [Modestobacter excelsi]